jgi:hypothetical protein
VTASATLVKVKAASADTTVAAGARVIGALSCSHAASRRIEVARS